MRRFLLSIALVLLAACPGNDKVTTKNVEWQGLPRDFLRVTEAAAFRVRDGGNARVSLRDSPLKLNSADGVRLFAIENGELKEIPTTAKGAELEAAFRPDLTYLVSLPLTEILTNRNRFLCRLNRLRWEHGIDRPFIPRICTLILCPPTDLRGRDLFEREPELREFPDQFNPDELRDLPLGGAAGDAAAGGICEQCIGGGGGVPRPPLIIDCPLRPGPKFTLINIIPEAMSAETHQDSEPNVAVKPNNTQHVAASAFTENPAGIGSAPIFVSEDRGSTWTACPTVDSDLMTGDITLRFTRTSDRLYAGILRRPGNLRLSIQSTDDFLDCATVMTERVGRNPVDQPYVQATDVNAADRVYVGNNDFNPPVAGRTATLDQTLAGPAGFTPLRLESRATSGQDLPPIRPAIGPNNVVYTAFIARRAGGTSDVVVTRDDAGGAGATPHRALVDADTNPGVRVATGLTVPFENFSHPDFGQERLVASDLSIAVHPNDAALVCVAWGDRTPNTVLTLHLRCSNDGGRTWTAGAGANGDILTHENAKAPALAFNSDGVLGFLSQHFVVSGTDQRWVAHFERLGTNFTLIGDTILATTPATVPAFTFIPYLGDYVHLMAVGNTFYGIFSANNTPDRNNFPVGVVYQRRHDFNARTLQDLAGNPVAASIDPFFFSMR